MTNPSDLKLSIIICTHRRINLLKLAVNSLVNQTAPKESYEVIVVDNDFKENPEVIELINSVKPNINISYIFEDKIGLSYARNIGGKAAKTKYVGYIDDDAKASKDYIKNLITAIEKYQPDILGGPYIPFYLTHKPKWFKNSYGEDPKKGYIGFLDSNNSISGMNICFTKALLNDIGWFDPKYGMQGKKIGYAEETVVQINAWKKYPNLRVYFHDDIYVEHLVSENKMRIFNRFIRKYKMGRSQAYLWVRRKDSTHDLYNAPLNLFKIIITLILKGIPNTFNRNRELFPYWQNYAYEKLSDYFASIGQEHQKVKDLFANILNDKRDSSR